MVNSLIFVPRAFLRIFHRDEPDSSHCSLLGLNSPRFGLLDCSILSIA
jgi:hypothetical protein